jgi:hypothetical protein
MDIQNGYTEQFPEKQEAAYTVTAYFARTFARRSRAAF